MKAAVFYGKHDLRVEERPIPWPGSQEVQIQVKACGICGTDVHIFNGDEGAAATPPGTVLGHEFAGTITAVGEGVAGFHVGDRACVDPNKLCGECDYCKSGIGHFCERMIGIGTTVDGGFAEYCCVPRSQVYPIGDIPFAKAAMTEPLACCIHGIDMCDISCGDTVLVIGGGMIGLLMLQLAKLRGAAHLILSEPVEEKRQLAECLGADLCIDPAKEDAKETLRAHGVRRVSTVIECVGSPRTMSQAVSLAGNKSTVMLFGLTKPDDTIQLKPFELFKKEITLRASYINPYTQKRAVELIGSGRIDVSSMVYEEAPLDELPKILGNGARRSKGKYIITP
ncbi:MAG: zinc-dependent alcohol dehydrogenase family protein [Clostridiales bacterium]|nr:zinc-dependent alcohol dehydrogenase family protein [Clostridiales bacterium]